MKRDMELVRLLLLDLEGENSESTETNLKDFSQSKIAYHVRLLTDTGFINSKTFPNYDSETGRTYISESLTWKGHDFLDDARDEKVWKTATDKIKNAVTSVSLDVLKTVLNQVAQDTILGN